MNPRLWIVVLLCGTGASVSAHRLDEYVQAAQVAVSTDRIGISLSLSPGIAVADAIVARLDHDGDGRIRPEEAEAYGRDVVADLLVSVDAQPLAFTLRRVEVPPIPELREGVGSIRIEADAVSPGLAPGAHALRLENRHALPGSVYLANALLPGTDAIQIRRQQRDPLQRTLLVEYDATPTSLANAAWLAVAVAALILHTRWRRGQ